MHTALTFHMFADDQLYAELFRIYARTRDITIEEEFCFGPNDLYTMVTQHTPISSPRAPFCRTMLQLPPS